MSNRRSGILFVKIDGVQRDAVGDFTYNLGQPKREALIGADKNHGFKENPQTPFVEGEIRDASDLDLEAFLNIDDATVTLSLNNGKTIVFREAWYAGDGDVGSDEANIQLRFEAISAEEV